MSEPHPDGTAEDGLRERRKRSTRHQLEDAAVRLFAREGFDSTTVEAIAAEAGISPRTFFRYFGSKDQALDAGRELRQARVREGILGWTDAGASDLCVAVEVLAQIAPDFEAERATMLLRRQAAQSSPVLRGRMYDALHSWERMLVAALAERRGVPADDLTVQVAGVTAIALWQHAVQRWLGESRTGLAATLRDAYAVISSPT